MKQIDQLATINIYTVADKKALLCNIKYDTGQEDGFYLEETVLAQIIEQLQTAQTNLKEWKVGK